MGFDGTSIVKLIHNQGIGFANVDPNKDSSCKVAASKYAKGEITPHIEDLAQAFGFGDAAAQADYTKNALASYKKMGWPKDYYGRGSIKVDAAGMIADVGTTLAAYAGGSVSGIALGGGAASMPLAAAPTASPTTEPTEVTEVVVEEIPSPAPPPQPVSRDLVRGLMGDVSIPAGDYLTNTIVGKDILAIGLGGNLSTASDRSLNEQYWTTKMEQPEPQARLYQSDGPVYLTLNPFADKDNYSNAGVKNAVKMVIKIVRGQPLMYAFSDAADADVYSFTDRGEVQNLAIQWSDPKTGMSTPEIVAFTMTDGTAYRLEDVPNDELPWVNTPGLPYGDGESAWMFTTPQDMYRSIQEEADWSTGEEAPEEAEEEDPFADMAGLFATSAPLPSGSTYIPLGITDTGLRFPPTTEESAYYYDPSQMNLYASPIMYEGTAQESRVLAQRPFSEEEATSLTLGMEGGDYLQVVIDMLDVGAAPTDEYSGIDNLSENAVEKRIVALTFPGDEFKLSPAKSDGEGFCLDGEVAVDPGTHIESISINKEGETVTSAKITFTNGTSAMIPDTATGFFAAKNVDDGMIFKGRVATMSTGNTESYSGLYEGNARVRKEGRIDPNMNPVLPDGTRGANSGAWIDKTNFNIVIPKMIRLDDGTLKQVLVRLTMIQE
ncbi:MAG: hypothetical protein CL398_00305 [Acidiferrobacteraceae bacterium]|nr:hypothetical protein [Acidiferrobacteraceae bacterium]